MARTVRVRAVPRGGTTDLGGGRSYRMQAGSMGAPDPNIVNPAEPFEAPLQDDAKWQAELKRREAMEGLPTQAIHYQPATQVTPTVWTIPSPIATKPVTVPGDLAGLPDRFTLVIEKKPDDWWKISAPEHHAGLFIAHKDLYACLADAPGALALILRMDGPVPVVPKRRRTK